METSIRSIWQTLSLTAIALMVGVPVQAFDTAPMHTITSQTYNLTFSGKVSGGMADSEVYAEISQNGRDIRVSAPTDAEGHYSLTLTLEAFPNDAVDWTLTARSGSLNSRIDEGRQILSTESLISFDKSHQITETVVLTAFLQ